ncbi:MAG: class I SAM-dependent rRNA methyltransferase, partial [Deltaproteobacteria bacterium]|nr:class I SAM-dependent rRNA methyltransferase [Deltaproteobacteria bacterium]
EIVLKPTRDRSIRRRHPWILSGAIARVEGAETPGDWVQVRSAEGEILGYGLLSPKSALRVRMLTIGKEAPADDLIAERIRLAVERRAANPLLGDTQAVRLVNAEGDGLPGLTVDRYADVVVVKMTAVGMQRRREQIAAVLRETTGAGVGFERADAAAARREGMSTEQGALWGTAPDGPFEICERDRRYRIDVVAGQKTGFYLDQRDSRDLVASLAAGRRVLDLFAYSGGFSVAAALGGASAVTLVESSAPALALAEENLAANAPGLTARFAKRDVHDFLREDQESYDLVVVDPPPLARNRRDVPRASRSYKDALLHALGRAAPGAYLLAFACSHNIDADLFRKIAFGAALDSGRAVQVLRVLGPPVDHPVSIDHPEGNYLTGLLMRA